MIFHKPIPFLVCIIVFLVLIVAGYIWLVLFIAPVFFLSSVMFRRVLHRPHKHSKRYIREVGKAADQLVCAMILGGQHDETISNWAGRRFLKDGWSSPWPVILIKKITDKWEPNHIETSIEPLRTEEGV